MEPIATLWPQDRAFRRRVNTNSTRLIPLFNDSSKLTPFAAQRVSSYVNIDSGLPNLDFSFRNQIPHRKTAADCRPSGRSVGSARKVSPNWSQGTMTCLSSNFFSIVWGQGNAT